MRDKGVCDACGEEVGQDNTTPTILGMKRWRICDYCNEEKSRHTLKAEVKQ